MTTNLLGFALTLVRGGFKNLSTGYTPQSIVCKMADTDGQVYRVEVTPLYYTVKTEECHATENK